MGVGGDWNQLALHVVVGICQRVGTDTDHTRSVNELFLPFSVVFGALDVVEGVHLRYIN